jgi:hypothetical protein
MITEMTRAEYLLALKADAALNGKCVECRRRPARPERKRCAECAKRHADHRQACLDAGLCRCSRPRETEHQQCAGCRLLDKERQKQRRDAAGIETPAGKWAVIVEQTRYDVATSVARHAVLEE